jgi:hypothetical protein
MRILFLLFLICTGFINNIISQDLIPYNKNGKWGYADKNMNIVIPCTYHEALPFYEDRALVVSYNDSMIDKRREFFIDSKGNIVFETKTAHSKDYSATRFMNGVTLIENYRSEDQNSLSMVDKNGKELKKFKNSSLTYEFLGYMFYCQSFNKHGFYISNFYDEQDNSTFIYSDGHFKNFDSLTINPFIGAYAIAFVEPNYRLIDSSGQTLYKTDKYALLSFYDGLLRVKGKDDKYGFLNQKGKVIIKPNLSFADDFSEGLSVFGVKDPKGNEYKLLYGYMDKKGKVVLPAIYDKAYNFSEGLADVVLGDSLFFIDKKGHKLLRFKFDNSLYGYTHGFKNGLAKIVQYAKIAWIDKNGNYVIPPLYSGLNLGSPMNTIYNFEQGLIQGVLPEIGLVYFDEEGSPYYERPYSILSKNENKIMYSSPHPDSLSDNNWFSYERVADVKNFSGKYLKTSDQETEWIQIEEPYVKGYALAKDYYTICYSIKRKKGTKIYSDEKGESVLDYLPFRFQLHSDKEIPNFDQLPDDANIPLIYLQSNYEDDAYKTVFIRKGDIEKMMKPQ